MLSSPNFMLGLPYVGEIWPLTSRSFPWHHPWLLPFKILLLKSAVEMLFLFICYDSSSLYSTQTIMQNKDKYNENIQHTESSHRKIITASLLKILAFTCFLSPSCVQIIFSVFQHHHYYYWRPENSSLRGSPVHPGMWSILGVEPLGRNVWKYTISSQQHQSNCYFYLILEPKKPMIRKAKWSGWVPAAMKWRSRGLNTAVTAFKPLPPHPISLI